MINKIEIIFEDGDLLVINKPPGLICNRADSVRGETLQDFMETKYSEIINQRSGEVDEIVNNEFIKRSGLVHRLDKDTSGTMILVKNAKTYAFIKGQFMDRKIKKKYWALVHGELSPRIGTINLPIKRNSFNREKFGVNIDGKMAKTKYRVISKYRAGDNEKEIYSLVEIDLLTGRTHQIRVHFSSLSYPLVSDSLYLGKRLDKDLNWCPRIFLHAKNLGFLHPNLDWMEFETNLTDDLLRCLEGLNKC